MHLCSNLLSINRINNTNLGFVALSPQKDRSSSSQELPVAMPIPGRRARILVRLSKGLILTVLSLMSLIMGLPVSVPGTDVELHGERESRILRASLRHKR